MTIKQALKNLYTAMCGGSTSKDGTAAIIDDIAVNYPGDGGSNLPAAGADGNVLTADDGEWVSAEPKASEYVIDGQLKINVGNGQLYVDGVTISQTALDAAIAEYDSVKMRLTAVAPLPEGMVQAYYSERGTEGSLPAYMFSGLFDLGDVKYAAFPYIRYSGIAVSVVLDLYEIGNIPSVDATNNGKLLGVSNGAYTLVANPETKTIMLTNDGQGNYTATLDGEAITIAEIMTLAAAGKELRAQTEIDNDRYVRVTLSTWDTHEKIVVFSAAGLDQSNNSTTLYAVGTNDGTSDSWAVGSTVAGT